MAAKMMMVVAVIAAMAWSVVSKAMSPPGVGIVASNKYNAGGCKSESRKRPQSQRRQDHHGRLRVL